MTSPDRRLSAPLSAFRSDLSREFAPLPVDFSKSKLESLPTTLRVPVASLFMIESYNGRLAQPFHSLYYHEMRLPRPLRFSKGGVSRKSGLGAVGPIYLDDFNTAVFLSSLAIMR